MGVWYTLKVRLDGLKSYVNIVDDFNILNVIYILYFKTGHEIKVFDFE